VIAMMSVSVSLMLPPGRRGRESRYVITILAAERSGRRVVRECAPEWSVGADQPDNTSNYSSARTVPDFVDP